MAIHKVEGVNDSDGIVNKVLPAGVYEAEVVSAEFIEIKKEGSKFLGGHMFKLGFKCEEDDVAVVAEWIVMLPHPEMDDAAKRKARAAIKRVQIACDLEEMGDDLDDEEFMHTNCQVEIYVKEDAQYGDKNIVKDTLPA